MSFTWVCPGELLPWVTHNLLWPFKVRWAAKEQCVQCPCHCQYNVADRPFASNPDPIPKTATAKPCGNKPPNSCRCSVSLSLCAALSQATAAHNRGGKKRSATSPKICKHIEM